MTMTLSAEIRRLGCSETSVTIEIIQNIWKTSQVSLKLKSDNKLKVKNVNMSLVLRKSVFGFPTRSDTNRAVQPHNMARDLKFRI